jgi:biotin transport system substrate-specific component
MEVTFMSGNNTDTLRRMVYAALFGALTAMGAFMVIPMQPVPITLQTLFTGLAGILLGSSAGALSQVVYVLLGIIGLPVFAGGKAGFGVLLGPTGGYLIGFIVGAYVIGKMSEFRPKSGYLWLAITLVAGNLVFYTFGTIQLMMAAHLSLNKALLIGVFPFLPGDIFKLLAAIWIAFKLRKYFPLGGNILS